MANEGRDAMKTRVILGLLISALLLLALPIALPSNLQAATQKDTNQTSEDEEMVLVVNVYGLTADGPYSDVRVPIINVSTSLLNPDQTAVWQETDVTGHNKRRRNASPDQLTAAWTKISDMVGRMLVKELSKKR